MLAKAWQKARDVNQTSNGYVAKDPTATEPTGTGTTATNASVINTAPNGVASYNAILLIPYGAGADDATFSVRVIGWKSIGGNGTTGLWIPFVLAELAVTLCTAVGVSAKIIVDTERFADTLVATKGNTTTSVDITSQADNTIAHAGVALKGSQKVELSFTTGGSATNCNALYLLL
jgi:hypothetical protein